MSTLPQRQFGIWITIGLAVAGALIAGAVLFASSKAGGVDLTSAALVPGDAGVYVAFNTDLSSDQWIAAFKLLERLGQEEPEKNLRRSAEEQGNLDWERDVAPFLGGNAAFYMRGFDLSGLSFGGASFKGAVIVRCKDAKRAIEAISEQSGADFESATYGGVSYLRDSLGSMFLARLDDHLVAASDEDSLHEVIDVKQGKKPSLASVGSFRTLRDELTGNFLGFVYVSTNDLFGKALAGDPQVERAIRDAGVGDLVFQPAAMAFGARGTSFEFQSASIGKGGAASPMMQPRQSRFAKLAPANTSVFFSTQDIAGTWDRAVKSAGKQIDDAIAQSGTYQNLDDALAGAGREIGLGSVRDVISLLSGETAVAAWFPTKDSNEPEVVMLAEVKDEGEAQRVMSALAGASSRAKPRTEKAGGVDMNVFSDENGDEMAYAVTGGYVAVGTSKAVKAVLGKEGGSLEQAAAYRDTLKQMPSGLGTFAYFDLGAILRLAEGGIPADLGQAEQALQGLIVNWVDERGVARFSGVLTIDK